MKFDPGRRKLSLRCLLLLVAALSVASELPAPLRSDDAFRNLSVGRHRVCLENQQYLHQELCCTNCRAGTFVLKPCQRDQEPGTCVPCEDGQSFTEHSNGMNRCLPCTHCRSDEEVTWPCSTTSDTRCQCRAGTFCVPDQACEVCKRCTRCKEGDEEVKSCTPFSNTICRKRDRAQPTLNPLAPPPPMAPPPPTAPPLPGFVLPLVLLSLLLLLLAAAALWAVYTHRWELTCLKTSCDSSEIVKIPIDESGAATAEERQNDQNAGLEGEEPRPESRPLLQETGAGLRKACAAVLEEEDRGLGDSLPNTTSSSQTSLSGPPPSGATPPSSPAPLRHLAPPTPPTAVNYMDDPLERPLVPLQGSERSLRLTFDLFDRYLDVRVVNRFFRLLGVSDNSIALAEGGASSDKVYDLLKVWLQREGLRADLNLLLEALLSLDQRRSAESIAADAIRKGYYGPAPSPSP